MINIYVDVPTSFEKLNKTTITRKNPVGLQLQKAGLYPITEDGLFAVA